MHASVPREDRREQIFSAAARLFAQKGYGRTSLQELAGALGVTKPALYYYYRSKEDLLFEILSFCIDRVTDDIEQVAASDLDPEGRVREWIRRYVRFFADHPHELTLLSTEVDALGPETRRIIVDKQRRYLDRARRLVEDLRAASGAPPLDPTVGAFALLGMMNWIHTWYDPAGAVDPEALADHFFRIFVYGVRGGFPGRPPGGSREPVRADP